MRVISGKYKGKKLFCTSDQSIRPTTNRIKEYIFDVLQDFCKEKMVADFFSGTGNLGIESLSRDAAHVEFIESSLSSINIIKRNLNGLDLSKNKFKITQMDAIKFSQKKNQHYDLIFMDPPFVYPPLNDLLENVFNNNFLNENGILALEHEITNPVNQNANRFEIIKQKKIGRSLISFIVDKRSSVD